MGELAKQAVARINYPELPTLKVSTALFAFLL